MKKSIILLTVISIFSSCSRYINIEKLNQEQVEYLISINMLTENEKVILFNSNYTFKNAGSFFTDKNVSRYWIDQHHPEKTEYIKIPYKKIIEINYKIIKAATYAHKIHIKDINNKNYYLYLSGSNSDVTCFYKKLKNEWEKNK